jgi:hypothetical protein
MRAVDLAVYADVLAARSAAAAARLEQTRDRIRQAAIERAARRSLDEDTVVRLEGLGVLDAYDARELRREAESLQQDLLALERLQAWAEARLFEAREERPAA